MNNKALFITFFLIFALLLGCCTTIVDADDADLAQQYAPILYFVNEETLYPVDVSYHIENSYLYNYSADGSILIISAPTVEELSQYSTDEYQDYFLDNQKGTITDNGVITHYQSQMNALGYTVYSRVIITGGTTVIQYWMFYAFNKGPLNIHEGDWEMVQVILSNTEPVSVMYSQHHGGQKATWEQVDKDGDHIKVYVAQGTHANYLRSYSGQVGAASDIVGDNGLVLQPNDYTLELLESQEWLNFTGRWGAYGGIEDEARGKVGPFGPKYREEGQMWNDPIAWGNALSQADNNIFLVEWFLYNFVTLFLIFTAISIIISALFIYRRYKKHGLGPRIFSVLYIDGLNLKSIGNVLCIVGILIAIFGLLNTWYGIAMDVNISGYETPEMVDMIIIDGLSGIRVNLLDPNVGLVQLGSLSLPFSLLVGIGLVFLIISTIGISKSKKIGKKYIYRGIRLAIYIIIILIGITSLGFLGDTMGQDQAQDVVASEIFDAISSNPFGGTTTIPLQIEGEESASLGLQWGLGQGGLLLLFAGLIIVIAGVLEFAAHATFFEEKQVAKLKKAKSKQPEAEIEEPKLDSSEDKLE